jgi:hypothetical protein
MCYASVQLSCTNYCLCATLLYSFPVQSTVYVLRLCTAFLYKPLSKYLSDLDLDLLLVLPDVRCFQRARVQARVWWKVLWHTTCEVPWL